MFGRLWSWSRFTFDGTFDGVRWLVLSWLTIFREDGARVAGSRYVVSGYERKKMMGHVRLRSTWILISVYPLFALSLFSSSAQGLVIAS